MMTPAPAWAGGTLSVLETPDARILYSARNEALAAKTAEIMAFAVRAVGEDLGRPARRVTVYIHDTAEEMVNGLMTTLGFNRVSAETIARVGISMRTRNTLHIHRRAGKWGEMFWHAVVHEHAHGMVEERYGPDIATKARWIYEGFGDYEANRALRTRLGETEKSYTDRMDRVAFKALVLGKLPRLKDISTSRRWEANIRKGREPWTIQYATAYAAVRYAVERYGLEKMKQVLERTGSGIPYQTAMRNVFDVSVFGFEVRYLTSLFLKGIFGLYVHYTLALAAGLLAPAGLLLLVLFRRRRAKAAAFTAAGSR